MSQRFIIPVWAHWARVKGRAWAQGLDLRTLRHNPATGEIYIVHQQDGEIPPPQGATLILIPAETRPADRGYDTSDYLAGEHDAGSSMYVYVDTETAEEVRQYAAQHHDFIWRMRDRYLPYDSTMLDP